MLSYISLYKVYNIDSMSERVYKSISLIKSEPESRLSLRQMPESLLISLLFYLLIIWNMMDSVQETSD